MDSAASDSTRRCASWVRRWWRIRKRPSGRGRDSRATACPRASRRSQTPSAVRARTPVVRPAPSDRRFRDPSWNENARVLRPPAGLSAVVAVHARAGGRGRSRAADRGQGAVRSRCNDRCARPDQHAGRKPRRVRRAVETGGSSVARGMERFLEDVATNEGRPSQVDLSRFELGTRPRSEPRPGRVPERADRADPVRADHAHGACHTAAAQPALDQQVLRPRPGAGPELHRMGGRARPHGVRHELRQPRARSTATRASTTTWATASSRRSTSSSRSPDPSA